MHRFLWFVVAPIAGAAAASASADLWQLTAGIVLLTPVAIVAGVHRSQPPHRAAWTLLGVGVVLLEAPALIERLAPMSGLSDVTPATLLGLCAPISLIAGTLIAIRARSQGRDRTAVLDAFTVAVGLGAVVWVVALQPTLSAAQLTPDERVTAVIGQVLDICLIGTAVRLAITPRPRTAALWAVVGALGVIAATHVASLAVATAVGTGLEQVEQLIRFGTITSGMWIGIAALHPSMRSLTEAASDTLELGPMRLWFLASACLVAPTLIAVQLVREGSVSGIGVLVGSTILLFVLVVVRMWGLALARERSAAYEKALREAGANLATATDREAILRAAIGAAKALAGEAAAVRMCDSPQRAGRFVVMASAGEGDATGARFSLQVFPDWKRAILETNGTFAVERHESTLVSDLFLARIDHGAVFTAPLFVQDELRGLMVVATASPMDRSLTDSLTALSTQVALALESAALTRHLLQQQSEARFASLVANSTDVVCVIDPDTRITYVSPAVARMLGHDPQALEGTRFASLIHPDDVAKAMHAIEQRDEGARDSVLAELRVRDGRGGYVHTETLVSDQLDDPNVAGIVLNIRDVTERRLFEEQLEHQAFHDSVTGLANRALFHDRVSHALARATREHGPISVLFMDLDDFKTINDSLGHAAGDQLLLEVGERLRACLRTADTAARLGGDEFAVLLEDGEEGVTAADVADRIMEVLEEPFTLEGKEVFIRSSVGIASAEGGNATDVEELLRNADVAMYMAKERGKGRYQVFEPAMHDTALQRLELKADLQRAIEHGEFELHYQPVIHLESGRVTGVEALIRWAHPSRGLVPPLEFIPLAEETGLIVPIGRWVLQEACRSAVELQERFPDDGALHMAVNLSVRQIARQEIVDEVRETLSSTGLDPRSLVLEITESVMMQDMDLSIERLGGLKGLGVRLAVDDFGTGYSSLNYIRRFPVDILKVDKSFVDGVSEDGEASALTEAVIRLAAILHLTPVAEGIERADQLERLLTLRCDLGQGYLFSRPLPIGELVTLLEERGSMRDEAEALARGNRA